MLKSLTAAAEFPSFPIIPIPTCASSIMPTSLPPSPMAKTVRPNCSFTKRTITAFSLGELRQKMTDFACAKRDAYKDIDGWLGCTISPICLPSTISVKGSPFKIYFLMYQQYFGTSQISVEILNTRQSSLISCERQPIFQAVSSLSPVIIITLISACCRRARVCGTSSCSLSYMPVAPMIYRLLYNASINSFSLSSASSFEIMRYLNSHFIFSFVVRYPLSSLTESSFLAKTSVLSPSLANASILLLNASESAYQCAFSNMAESAPLVKRVTLFLLLGSLTTTLMRLRLLNGTISNNSSFFGRPSSSRVAVCLALLSKEYPMECANSTKQTSSGLDPWYSSRLESLTTSWHTAIANTNQ